MCETIESIKNSNNCQHLSKTDIKSVIKSLLSTIVCVNILYAKQVKLDSHAFTLTIDAIGAYRTLYNYDLHI